MILVAEAKILFNRCTKNINMCSIEGCENSSQYSVKIGDLEMDVCAEHLIRTVEMITEGHFNSMKGKLEVVISEL